MHSQYAVERNFAQNLFSQYSPSGDPIFQIDANFGYPAALLVSCPSPHPPPYTHQLRSQNGLIQTPDSASLSDVFTINILPALPAQWKSGSIRNARLRGGLGVSFSWGPAPGITSLTVSADANAAPRRMRVVHEGKELAAFNVKPGIQMQIV